MLGITNLHIRLAKISFTKWTRGRPTYYTIRPFRWLYNLVNLITDKLTLNDDEVRLRIVMSKPVVDYAISGRVTLEKGDIISTETGSDDPNSRISTLEKILKNKGIDVKKVTKVSDNEVRVEAQE